MSHGYEQINRVVGLIVDGRTIAKGVDLNRVITGGVYVEVTIPNLRYVEEVLDIQLSTNPFTTIGDYPQVVSITGNVVGITISGVAAGTSLDTEVIAVGV